MKGVSTVRYRLPANARQSLRVLYQLDDFHGPLAVTTNITIVAIAIVATLMISWWLYPLAVLVIGSRQRAFATMTHEATHRTLARSPRLNDILGTVFGGYLVWSTFSAYQNSHVRGHHGNFGDPELDADYSYMIERGLYTHDTRWGRIKAFVIKPLLLFYVPSYLKYVWQFRIAQHDREATAEGRLLTLYWVIILLLALTLGVLPYLFLFWIFPFLTSFQIIGWFIEVAEHGPLMQSGNSLEMTRNRNSHWLEAAFTAMHNEHLHLVHHLCPGVPFWNLPRLHRILLSDGAYAAWNAKSGGIFLSANNAPSALSLIISGQHASPATLGETA